MSEKEHLCFPLAYVLFGFPTLNERLIFSSLFSFCLQQPFAFVVSHLHSSLALSLLHFLGRSTEVIGMWDG